MWNELERKKKDKYKILITNFASLSEAFSQKAETEDGKEIIETVAPIVNSKFQETAFQRAFGALGEDIANTSYDASLKLDDKHKYLVGIKSFGIHSGDQKIAQFKANSEADGWNVTLAKVKENALVIDSKERADIENEPLYRDVALKIAKLRNERIASSKEQIKGFDANDVNVEAVYHVLMPSKKGEKPQINVGETDYLPIDVENLTILGSTGLKTPTNFKFTDGQHNYKYTAADSQLLMTFNNREIVVETWDVEYVADAFSFFENLHENFEIGALAANEPAIIQETVSWMIADENGYVEENSGFNGFDGATKLGKKDEYRENRIAKFENEYTEYMSNEDMSFIVAHLNDILLNEWRSIEDKRQMKRLRAELMELVESLGNKEIENAVSKLVYRPASEMYIPIPDSRKFHNEHPDFFGKNIGTFMDGTSKLALSKSERSFRLEFLPSGDAITAYINQDNGKSIQSTQNQGILGEWILRGVFQLAKREPLTGKRLDELGINAIRLKKFSDHARGIGLEFTWIDVSNPPSDAIGWVSRLSRENIVSGASYDLTRKGTIMPLVAEHDTQKYDTSGHE
ncbi:hypothetical protein [Rummeliibacillus pycnus]|uniref:hypothetical protein n=1 Tax=Rummeliibacillus pycnus TaxID=101070 RepID=UPI001B7FF7BE|nr:hypothetical protein [Rummeliibacillus pycnus]